MFCGTMQTSDLYQSSSKKAPQVITSNKTYMSHVAHIPCRTCPMSHVSHMSHVSYVPHVPRVPHVPHVPHISTTLLLKTPLCFLILDKKPASTPIKESLSNQHQYRTHVPHTRLERDSLLNQEAVCRHSHGRTWLHAGGEPQLWARRLLLSGPSSGQVSY